MGRTVTPKIKYPWPARNMNKKNSLKSEFFKPLS